MVRARARPSAPARRPRARRGTSRPGGKARRRAPRRARRRRRAPRSGAHAPGSARSSELHRRAPGHLMLNCGLERSSRPRKIKRSSDPLVPRGRGHNAPRGDTTPCRRVSASDRARGKRRDREVRCARTGRPTEDTSARSALGKGSASTGGSEAGARSAGAPRSASTGGCEAGARSAGEEASASTGGGEASARSVARLARHPLG